MTAAVIAAFTPMLLLNCTGPIGPPAEADLPLYSLLVNRNLSNAGLVWPVMEDDIDPKTPINIYAIADIKDIVEIDGIQDMNIIIDKWTEEGDINLFNLLSTIEVNDFMFHRWTVVAGKATFGNANDANTTVTLSSTAIIRANFVIKPNRQFNPNVTYSSFTDSRDGQSYRTIVIGGKRWMAENLNYKTSDGSRCYNSNSYNCITFGRLYDWNAAKNACPAGWWLPSREEWNDLIRAADDDGDDRRAGTRLKSRTGWNYPLDMGIFNLGNGTDIYGFSALPGGLFGSYISYIPGASILTEIGYTGAWWSATESGSRWAYRMLISSADSDVHVGGLNKNMMASVRCVQEE